MNLLKVEPNFGSSKSKVNLALWKLEVDECLTITLLAIEIGLSQSYQARNFEVLEFPRRSHTTNGFRN